MLEHDYLVRVERAHGLPRGRRQASHRHAGSLMFRDVQYDDLELVVELDGRLFHGSVRARDRDMDRDLFAAVDGSETLRLGWGQVFDRPCATARGVAAVMRRRGWTGALRTRPTCG
ncbi:very-short-patch-repair endonuclease [Nocardioides ginsengisegetis]|uniref:Very-short-patch-repair endonuclease n=1 Tax=Nocardioides ginsengisegetis TaxID=661491 RepID=A0A7W3P8P7_9ACTN|nr:hypothetical protein [Nocardioides ginsengisegetis]MBA8802815.1 very-short-patch-repair endonuclease [Nocardioides ginsengisegetis]